MNEYDVDIDNNYVCIPSRIAISPQGCSLPRHEFLRFLRLLHGHARHDPAPSGPRPQVHLPFNQSGEIDPLPRRATPQLLSILAHRGPQSRLQQVHQLHPRVIHSIEIIHNPSQLRVKLDHIIKPRSAGFCVLCGSLFTLLSRSTLAALSYIFFVKDLRSSASA